MIEETKKELAVGDIVYTSSRWNGLSRHKIERITNKQAFSGMLKMKKELQKSYFGGLAAKVLGDYGTADLETPELLEDWNNQQLERKAKRLLSDLKITQLKPDQQAQFISLIESFNIPNNKQG